MKLKHGKKTGLKKFTINDIRCWSPCYNPNRYLKEDFKGSALDILNDERIPFQDRLWVVLRTEIVSEKVMRLFAVCSYRQTLKFITDPDSRSVNAANVAESYALGQASKEELSAAESAAWAAEEAAAWSATWSAAESTAAWSAARAAAWSAAESAAESAAFAAKSAAKSAAESAALAARSAAESAAFAAKSAAKSAQKEKLIEMILVEAKERVNK